MNHQLEIDCFNITRLEDAWLGTIQKVASYSILSNFLFPTEFGIYISDQKQFSECVAVALSIILLGQILGKVLNDVNYLTFLRKSPS